MPHPTMQLTPAQAHRLIETYCLDTPRTDAIERLTAAGLHVFDTPRGYRIEYRPDPTGKLVAWLSHDQLDRVIDGRR